MAGVCKQHIFMTGFGYGLTSSLQFCLREKIKYSILVARFIFQVPTPLHGRPAEKGPDQTQSPERIQNVTPV